MHNLWPLAYLYRIKVVQNEQEICKAESINTQISAFETCGPS